MTLAYLNGAYIPLEDARISVLDRGFMFGDGVYEVIPVFNKSVFLFEQHIRRLENSLRLIYMKNPLAQDDWKVIFNKLINSIPDPDQSIYLQVTRGPSERDHSIYAADKPTVFAMNKPIVKTERSSGISAITHEDIRWEYCHIKATTLLASIILRHKACENNALEAILFRQDRVTEGAASNVFVVKDGHVKTPAKDTYILAGITRDLLVEILNHNKIPCTEESINLDELDRADEIWITSSTWEIVPVIKLDNKPVGNGVPGEVYKKAVQAYEAYKKSVTSNQNPSQN